MCCLREKSRQGSECSYFLDVGFEEQGLRSRPTSGKAGRGRSSWKIRLRKAVAVACLPCVFRRTASRVKDGLRVGPPGGPAVKEWYQGSLPCDGIAGDWFYVVAFVFAKERHREGRGR